MRDRQGRRSGNVGMGTRRLTRAAGLGVPSGDSFERLEARTLFAADPITPNHPLWIAVDGSAKIDGAIRESEWAGAATIVRTQPHRDGSNITLRAMFGDRGLIVAADIRDDRLWADGSGGGAGKRWEFYQDDSLVLFFDPANTRAKYLPSTGRMIAFNIGKMTGSANGSGRVARYDFLRGDGAGHGALVNFDNSLTAGMKWATRVNGSVNNNNKPDVGWTAEIIIPWEALGMAGRPANGQSIGMNFEVFMDNDGGERTGGYFGTDPDAAKRHGDRVIDDHINGVFGGYSTSNTGWNGPVNYAVLQFVDRGAEDRPRAIVGLAARAVSGYGARLNFKAPAATLGGKGNVSGYEVRWSGTPIVSEGDWASAGVIENTFVPHLKGKKESLRIGRLSPGTGYHVAVRAADFAGRLGDIASVSFTTLGTDLDTSGGQRVMVSPMGNTMMTESGEPFVMVGGTVGTSNVYARSLYGGLLWSDAEDEFVDYTQAENPQGTAPGYFNALADYGVNTLRLQLEWTRLVDDSEARSQLPEGMPWLEWREPGDSQSEFNPEMKEYLHAMMEQADRTGVRFILQTFNNFNYGNYFELTPFAAENGGPITDMDGFYSSPEVLAMAKRRMQVLAEWVRESPHAHTMIGFELVNEWDAASTQAGSEAEMRARSKFMVKLSAALRSYAPELNVMSASIALAPTGPGARALYYSDAFDVLDPHYYTPSTAEPVNNPAADRSVRPAMDYGGLAAYWLTSRRDARPVHNGEWDLVGRRWPGGTSYYTGYSDEADPDHPYTLAEDESIYRAASWVSLASGLAGTGLRIGGSEIRDTYPEDPTPDTTGYLPVPLSLGMRQVQRSVSGFVQGADGGMEFDWAAYRARTLSGRLRFANAGGHTLKAWGSTDGDQGLVYLLRDAGRSVGDVSGARLKIEGLGAGGVFEFEFWSTGADAEVVGTLGGVVSGSKFTLVDLPVFGADVVMKFRRVG